MARAGFKGHERFNYESEYLLRGLDSSGTEVPKEQDIT